jgi:hypothetical protein
MDEQESDEEAPWESSMRLFSRLGRVLGDLRRVGRKC